MERTTFLTPTNFWEQKKSVEKLKSLQKMDLSMILVDTLTALYRVEMNSDDNQEITQDIQTDEIEDADTGAYDFYINEDGKKVIVVNTGDALSIGE